MAFGVNGKSVGNTIDPEVLAHLNQAIGGQAGRIEAIPHAALAAHHEALAAHFAQPHPEIAQMHTALAGAHRTATPIATGGREDLRGRVKAIADRKKSTASVPPPFAHGLD